MAFLFIKIISLTIFYISFFINGIPFDYLALYLNLFFRNMKKILTALALALGITASSYAQYENTAIKIGQKAPDLAYANPEGKVLKLSDINKGHYLLVDFWASWCGPCRMSNPGLVAMYKEYSQKKFKGAKQGFTVLNVSLDKDKEPWIAAIKKDNLTWPNHISDLGGWQSRAAATYGVQYIPQAFLIGPDGKVIGKYNRGEEARADLDKYVAQ
jgi:thiol-disulfide isomerase/thioredoxin